MPWRSPAPISAAIFDFDGTLVDTLPLHYEAYRRVFAGMGVELTPDQFYPNLGGKAPETIPRFLAGRPCPLSVSEIHRRKLDLFARLLSESSVRELDTARVLEALAERMPVALASSGSRPGIERILATVRWGRAFQVIVTGEDVARGKPAPDIFLHAASRLAIPPSACLVFEDSDDGVAAGTAAGMIVVDVRRMSAAAMPA